MRGYSILSLFLCHFKYRIFLGFVQVRGNLGCLGLSSYFSLIDKIILVNYYEMGNFIAEKY